MWVRDDTVGDGPASSASGSAIDKVAESVASAVGDSIKDLATLWTKVPVEGLGDGDVVGRVQANLIWYAMGFAIIGLMIAGAQMAIQGRGRPAREALQSLVTLVLITGASIPLATLAIAAGDDLAGYLMGDDASRGFADRMSALLDGVTSDSDTLSPALVIVGGLLVLLATLAQIAFLLIRPAVLVLLVGVLPLAAAATNTSVGRQWFQKIVGWCAAFVLYKPAAALIYAVAFELFGRSKGLIGMVMALILMGLALVALPALIRLCVPAAGAVVGAASTGGVLAGALGAADVTGRSSGGRGPTGAISTASRSMSTPTQTAPSGAPASVTGAAPDSGADAGRDAQSPSATGRVAVASDATARTSHDPDHDTAHDTGERTAEGDDA